MPSSVPSGEVSTSGDSQPTVASPLVPIRVLDQTSTAAEERPSQVTLALNLVLEDLPRAALLLASLSAFLDPQAVSRAIIVAPDAEYEPLKLALAGSAAVPFPVTLVRESALLGQRRPQEWDTYATQMALKLLVSNMVETQYYLTLDADVLALRKMGLPDLLPGGKALYIDER